MDGEGEREVNRGGRKRADEIGKRRKGGFMTHCIHY